MSKLDATNCLKRYITKVDEKGKPIKNIANYGLSQMETAKVMRNGEYFGVEIQALEYIKPLFTTQSIIKAYELLLKENYLSIIQILKIEKEYTVYGNDIVHYIISKWCSTVKIECPTNIKNISTINLSLDVQKNLDNHIHLNRSDEVVGKFKIINVGQNQNTGSSVLPIEWIDKEFNSAKELHSEMNKLDYRRGSPPVTYCCTYGMIITTDSDIKQWLNIKQYDLATINHDMYLVIDREINNVKSFLTKNINDIKILQKSKTKSFELIFVPKQKYLKILIIVESTIFVKNNTKSLLTKDNTSYLSSLIQKCFRDHNAKELLEETVDKLHYSAGYNLPDQHFARVSGCRQLCWRSFISIIEDVSPYNVDKFEQLDLLDLFALSCVAHIDPNVLIDKNILSQFKNSLTVCQSNTICWDWRKGADIFVTRKYDEIVSKLEISQNMYLNRNPNAFLLALLLMPMMQNDFLMLSRGYNYLLTEFKPKLLNEIANSFTKKSIEKYDDYLNFEVKMTAMDMHCFPYILIQLQGSLPFIPSKQYVLKNLSKFIWQNSSGINKRYFDPSKLTIESKNDLDVLRTLYDIQDISLNGYDSGLSHKWIYLDNKLIGKNKVETIDNLDNNLDNNYIGRLAFLLIFGKKYKLNKKIGSKQYDIVICGSDKYACKVKKSIDRQKMTYIDGKERYNAEKEFVLEFSDIVNFKLLSPPVGHKWIDQIIGKPQKLSITIVKDIGPEYTHQLEFYVGSIKIKPFDGSTLIQKLISKNIYELPEELKEYINVVFYNDYGNIFETLLELFKISKQRIAANSNQMYDWENIADKNSSQLIIILMYVRSKFLMAREYLHIGPVDRSGNKTLYSINSQHEGPMWRILIGLTALYPDTCIPVSPYKFKIIKTTVGYLHLMQVFDNIIINAKKPKPTLLLANQELPKIKTKLWEHQSKSIDKIIYGITVERRKGFGDASDVGAGKTLTALGTLVKILEYINNINKKNTIVCNNTGFLILLPSNKLFDTWQTEITKHTSGFDTYIQQPNGKLCNDSNCKITSSAIKYNTIVITTMGRCRDHPIVHQWLLTVIDECLTVQNKDALQTEEAWRQSSYSYFGVLMLSATFFRSRFEKMLYMLSMLNTGLPETPEYLDSILSESMVCNLSEKERKWIVNVNKEILSQSQQVTYNNLANQHTELGFEKVYHLLNNFIRTNVNYINIFIQTINKIVKLRPKSKILIYTASKDEADNLAKLSLNIGRYPNISKTHVILSYSEGTYGLNNLVEFDTILTRVPESDKLPQMKGRLDRPGQKSNILYLEYLLITNTVEDANLYKLEVANNFYGNYVLPLAEYYKIAVVGK